jgi:hypothetical protein
MADEDQLFDEALADF